MPDASARLPRSFFDRPVLEVAPDVLGRTLVRVTPEGAIRLRITEVEAYDGPNDPGSHAYRGRTARNAVMFGPPGHLYVYFTYGMHHCANLVCGPEGTPSGVLLRGGEVIAGTRIARARRAATTRGDADLARGPARLATALGFDLTDGGTDVCAPDGTPDTTLWVEPGRPPAPSAVRRGPRTGVGGAGATLPWRFHIEGDPTVSPYRAHQPRRRPGRTGDAGR